VHNSHTHMLHPSILNSHSSIFTLSKSLEDITLLTIIITTPTVNIINMIVIVTMELGSQISEFLRPDTLFLLILKIRNWLFDIVSAGTMYVYNFIKIFVVVLELKHVEEHTDDGRKDKQTHMTVLVSDIFLQALRTRKRDLCNGRHFLLHIYLLLLLLLFYLCEYLITQIRIQYTRMLNLPYIILQFVIVVVLVFVDPNNTSYTILYVERLNVFMIYINTKFHMPGSNG
jgi:hypothetical protein